jgi:hypothetical protein
MLRDLSKLRGILANRINPGRSQSPIMGLWEDALANELIVFKNGVTRNARLEKTTRIEER